MRIAILGGSFDPPHLGHYWVTRQILDFRPDIDHILLMPAYEHQWKPIIASVADRLSMLRTIEEEKIKISTIEIDRGGVSYTLDTIKEVKKNTHADIFWVVGSDILSEFDRWDKTDDIADRATFLVFPRDPHLIPDVLPEGFEAIRVPNLITSNISSTAVRDRIRNGRSISQFVPKKVEEYIQKKGLYK